ncbi:unnamed protein product [Caenorhabditis angaria]|uniref:Uncharacterized protein n=1 Tax=Caenorhabditis angaria TaxID=860376 RepID=A0A9P1IVY9_9PELO|nr:unnamed protein product [Caenorhabditis angaria]
MFTFLFEKMERSDKSYYIPQVKNGQHIQSEILNAFKDEFLQSKTPIFMDENIENDTVFEIVNDYSILFGDQKLVEFMIKRIDHINNKDVTIAVKYALTLLKNNHEDSGYYQSDDENIRKILLDKLNFEMNKKWSELEKLELVLELVNSFVDLKSIDDDTFGLTRENIEDYRLRLMNYKKLNTLRISHLFASFEKKVNETPEIDDFPIDGRVSRLLRQNKEVGFKKWIVYMENEKDIDCLMKKMMKFSPGSDSYFNIDLHSKLLTKLLEAKDQEKLDERLQWLEASSFSNEEVLKNWVNASTNYNALNIVAKFMANMKPNAEIIKIAANFLLKINQVDISQAIALANIFGPIRTTVLEPATEIFLEKKTTKEFVKKLRKWEFFGTLDKLAKFFERKNFIKVLLMRIDLLLDKESNPRFALTLAQCGFNRDFGYQLNPADNRRNQRIVDIIFNYLDNQIYRSNPKITSIEVAVQIFHNFVEIHFDTFWMFVDFENVDMLLKQWAASCLIDNNPGCNNLRAKINELFMPNKIIREQPSFGSKYEVVDERRAEKYL